MKIYLEVIDEDHKSTATFKISTAAYSTARLRTQIANFITEKLLYGEDCWIESWINKDTGGTFDQGKD